MKMVTIDVNAESPTCGFGHAMTKGLRAVTRMKTNIPSLENHSLEASSSVESL